MAKKKKIIFSPNELGKEFMEKFGITEMSSGNIHIQTEGHVEEDPKNYWCPGCSYIQDSVFVCENCEYHGLDEML